MENKTNSVTQKRNKTIQNVTKLVSLTTCIQKKISFMTTFVVFCDNVDRIVRGKDGVTLKTSVSKMKVKNIDKEVCEL